eukprot:SAG22_NODE_795_length_7149_cov_16.608227_4_plen_274_part_00
MHAGAPTADMAAWQQSVDVRHCSLRPSSCLLWDGRASSTGTPAAAAARASAGAASVASRFPRDLFLAIFRLLDSGTLGMCSVVCREWAAMCWHPRLWMWKCEEFCQHRLDGRAGPWPNLQRKMLNNYGSWRYMYIHIPRARLNGCYVSMKTYNREVGAGVSAQERKFQATAGKTRRGLSDSGRGRNALFYQYLRFYRSGAVLSLTTTEPPPHVMPHFSSKAGARRWDNVHPGTYELRFTSVGCNLHVRLEQRLKSHPKMLPTEYRMDFEIGER